jgi:PASTA domain/Right handed beta helix region/Divergent InlB B-repeat domain
VKEVRHLVIGAAAVGAGLIAFASGPDPARAATVWYVAPTGSDADSCASPAAPCVTINGAIAKAGGGDTVDVATGTYSGAGNEVVLIDKDLTLEGGWSSDFTTQTGASTVDAGNFHLGVRVDSAAAALDRFVIENANETLLNPDAGGIYVDGTGASLDLSTSTVRDNKWGAMWSSGPVSVTDSTIEGNTGRFGNGGGVTVTHGAPLTIVNSTISGNTAEFGGGILVVAASDSPVDLSNVTIVGNTATRGPSLPPSPAGYGGGIWLGNGEVFIRNSIVSGNSADNLDPNLPAGTVFSDGHNIETGYPPADTDIVTPSPNVEPLADNGGPTETRALRFDSPALDGGDPAGCTDAFGDPIVTDQRGVDRPLRYACDIGAFEAVPPGNDNFVDATHLAGPVTGSNEFASKEPGEPDLAADPGGASVWYSLTPSFSGTAFVSTAGSSFDTLLGVFTGSTVSGLTTRAESDDATEAVLTSKACFTAVAGTPYHVAIDGVGAASAEAMSQGSFSLSSGQYSDPHPCAELPPSISGTPQVGVTLTASPGTWAGPSSGFEYQWFVCGDVSCSDISGATTSTYTPVPGDAGMQLFVGVTALDPDPSYDVPSTSALTATVLAAPPPPTPPPPPPPNFTLTVTEAGSGSGTVTSTPAGIACGSTCARAYPSGTIVTLSASASSGSKFAGWSGSVCSGTGTCVITMSVAKVVTATFTQLPKPCIVPKIKGKRLKPAERAIKSHACRVGRVKRAFSDHVKKGRVISQRPKPGRRLAHGAKVNLIVSKGRH